MLDGKELDGRWRQVDPQTQEFMVWCSERLRDDKFLTALIVRVTQEARVSLLSRLPDMGQMLEDKMFIGAKKHGPPIHSAERLQAEILAERLDLIGWELVKQYNEKLRDEAQREV